MLSTHAFSRSPSSTSKRYEPFAQIGRGGMAEVLLAMADAGGGTRRLAVLKRIGPELATDPDFVEMFLDEARLSLRLSHANVVQTYELLVGDNELALAMEYLDGQPLTRVLNRLLRGPTELSLPLRLRILTKILAGLEHAHTLTDLDGTSLGVVHRDVSPQNVFVTYDGQVKLVDFGVAKTLVASHQTRPGAIKGKLVYMAPEQLRAESIDRRADLFSVGVMLWEMLALRRMWHKKTEVEIVGHLSSGRPMPPLPVRADDLPPGLDAICMRALEIDPARRYQTAAEMEMDLEEVLVGVADSHTRNLGTVVSLAFAAERAERQAIIERCLRRNAEQGTHKEPALTVTATFGADPLPTIEVPPSMEGFDDRTPPGEAASVAGAPVDAAPPVRTAAPLADIGAPSRRITAPLASFGAPSVRVSAPLADVAAPLAEFPQPRAEVPQPRANAGSPLADFAPPLADIAAPLIDVANPFIEPVTPPKARRVTPVGVTPLADVSVAASEAPTRSLRAIDLPPSFAEDVPAIAATSRALRRWRAAAVAGLAAFAVTVLVGVVLRRGSDVRPAPSAAAVAAQPVAAPPPPAAPAAIAPLHLRAARSAGPKAATGEEAERPRRHRRPKPSVDEDATLPPTGTASETDL